MRDIGKNIRFLRTGKGMTQEELADRLFVTRQTVSNYETGKSRPDVETLVRIADILGADIQEIIYEPEDASDRRRRILAVTATAVVMAVLGILLVLLADYANSRQAVTYQIGLAFLILLFLQPGYFFLIGYLFPVSLGILRIAKPLSPVTRTRLGWIALGCILLALAALLPYFAAPILNWMGIAGYRVPALWSRVVPYLLKHDIQVWMPLIPGILLGFRAQWKLP